MPVTAMTRPPAIPKLSLAERTLYHQVRPLKLATDIGTAAASLVLLWQHRLLVALLVMWVPSIVVTAWLLRSGDFRATRDAPIGDYLRRYMTRGMEGVRFLGLGLAAAGAWRHAGWLIPVGAAVTVWGWIGAWAMQRLRRGKS